MKRLRYLRDRHPIVLGLFAASLVLAAVFLFRFALLAEYWSKADVAEIRIEGWMTPTYIARVYDVPPEIVHHALGTDVTSTRRKSLRDMAQDWDVPLVSLETQVADTIRGHRNLQK
ncbi:MAG: hypothetical protein AAGF74_10990 [Pseudomonadota bacterium]